MRICVLTEQQFIEKSAVGAIATGLAFLGHKLCVARHTDNNNHTLAFHFPTLPIEYYDWHAQELRECEIVVADTCQVQQFPLANKTLLFVAETIQTAHIYALLDIRKRAAKLLLLCTQEDTYAVAKSCNLPAIFIPLGAPDTVHLISPENCFQKEQWLTFYDYDTYNCLPTTALAHKLAMEIPYARIYAISHRIYERLDFHAMYRMAALYDKEAHNLAPLPVLATSKVVVTEAPANINHFYFPYRLYHTALAMNCWVVAVGYARPLNLHGLIMVNNYDDAKHAIERVCSTEASPPFTTAKQLIKFRNANTISTQLARHLKEVVPLV